MEFNFDDKRLDLGLRANIAVKLDYKTLLNLCNTEEEGRRKNKSAVNEVCESNWFWEEKTKYDFGDLYNIEELGENWWDTYQRYRKRFTEDLIEAIKRKNPEEAERLLRINKERQFLLVDFQNTEGETVLTVASKKLPRIAKMLLEAGADPNFAGEGGDTPLIWASKLGKFDIVEMLLEAGANPNLVDDSGMTALMWASKRGQTLDRRHWYRNYSTVINMLLSAKADPNIVNKEGLTALDLARRRFYHDAVKILEDASET